MRKVLFFTLLLSLWLPGCRPGKEEASPGLLLSYPSLLSHYIAPPDLKLWFSPGCDPGTNPAFYLCYGRDFLPEGTELENDSLLNLRWTAAWRAKELPPLMLAVLLPPRSSEGHYLPAAALPALPDSLQRVFLPNGHKKSESPLASFFIEELFPFLRSRTGSFDLPRLMACGVESLPVAGALAARPDSFALAFICSPDLPQIPEKWRKTFVKSWLDSLPAGSARKVQLLIFPENAMQPLPDWIRCLTESDAFDIKPAKGKPFATPPVSVFELIRRGKDQPRSAPSEILRPS